MNHPSKLVITSLILALAAAPLNAADSAFSKTPFSVDTAISSQQNRPANSFQPDPVKAPRMTKTKVAILLASVAAVTVGVLLARGSKGPASSRPASTPANYGPSGVPPPIGSTLIINGVPQ